MVETSTRSRGRHARQAGKTLNLIAAMKAAVPFEVELTPPLRAHLRAENVASDIAPRQLGREISYSGDEDSGDEGGILCHIQPDGSDRRLVVWLTHLQVRRTLPFAAAALEYQKHRVKKLKKQQPSY